MISLNGRNEEEEHSLPAKYTGLRRRITMILLVSINLLNYLDRYTVSVRTGMCLHCHHSNQHWLGNSAVASRQERFGIQQRPL